MSQKILVTGKIFLSNNINIFKEQGFDVELQKEYIDENALVNVLVGKDAYILGGREVATKEVINKTNRLKVIAIMGSGYQSFVDLDAANQKGIVVTNTPDSNTRAVAEMTIGFMLSMRRKIFFINHLTKTGQWCDDIVSKDLYGQVLGIIGMGKIGIMVAHIAHYGFGMNIIYHNRNTKPAVAQYLGAKKVSMDELLNVSDFISIHCPITKETKDMIGEEEFSKMKKSAILINNARPHVVKPDALYTALKERKIAGCAMDGYYTEFSPNPNNDPYGLLKLPDEIFLVSSHVAYLTKDSIIKMCDLATNSVINVLKGKKDEYIVNPEVWGN